MPNRISSLERKLTNINKGYLSRACPTPVARLEPHALPHSEASAAWLTFLARLPGASVPRRRPLFGKLGRWTMRSAVPPRSIVKLFEAFGDVFVARAAR